MEDQLTQEEEIMALRSIYEEEDMFSFDTEQNSGTFYVKITASESIFFNLKFGKPFCYLFFKSHF